MKKKTDEYYQYSIHNNPDLEYHDFIHSELYEDLIFETIPHKCIYCNKNLQDDITDSKELLSKNERLFIFVSKTSTQYWYIYYHYCKDCYHKGMYYFMKTYHKLPHLRLDGARFVNMDSYVPKEIDRDTLTIINNSNYPIIYNCDYYKPGSL